MTKLVTLALGVTFAILGAEAAFKTPCAQDFDVCGWDLQATYGYDQATLSEATTYAGQDAGKGSIVYDSIYNCYPDGEVVWSAWCGGAGECNPPVNKASPAMCKGEPVDTGATPPEDGGEGDGEGGGDDGGVIYDPPIGRR